jgi:hypothetical protein
MPRALNELSDVMNQSLTEPTFTLLGHDTTNHRTNHHHLLSHQTIHGREPVRVKIQTGKVSMNEKEDWLLKLRHGTIPKKLFRNALRESIVTDVPLFFLVIELIARTHRKNRPLLVKHTAKILEILLVIRLHAMHTDDLEMRRINFVIRGVDRKVRVANLFRLHSSTANLIPVQTLVKTKSTQLPKDGPKLTKDVWIPILQTSIDPAVSKILRCPHHLIRQVQMAHTN